MKTDRMAERAERAAVAAFGRWADLPHRHPLAASFLRIKANWHAIADAWRAVNPKPRILNLKRP